MKVYIVMVDSLPSNTPCWPESVWDNRDSANAQAKCLEGFVEELELKNTKDG